MHTFHTCRDMVQLIYFKKFFMGYGKALCDDNAKSNELCVFGIKI